MTKDTCETCRFWLKKSHDGGDCRRYPPSHPVSMEILFPWVQPSDWCGEHQMERIDE